MKSGAKIAIAVGVAVAVYVALSEARALTLNDCTRSVNVHGEEYGHTDLTGGLVMWGERWTNQGNADDLFMAECQSGNALTARMMSQGMQEAIPYDRRAQAGSAMSNLLEGSMAFLNLDRAEDALESARVPVERMVLAKEPCVCAALYPDAVGNKTPFEGRP